MKLYVLMEDMSYDGHKFLGVYDNIDKLTEAAGKYTEESSSPPELFYNEIELNGKPNEILKEGKLTLKYIVEEYESSIQVDKETRSGN